MLVRFALRSSEACTGDALATTCQGLFQIIIDVIILDENESLSIQVDVSIL